MLAETLTESASGDSARTRCVLLAAGGEQPPERLMRLLDQPSTETVTVAHPLLAAAELALLERARLADALLDSEEEARTVLVVVNRESWRDLSSLFRMVRLQMPEVSIWVCTERVAIEVYAGNEINEVADEEADGPPARAESVAPAEIPAEARDESSNVGSKKGESTDVSDEELERLLELFDAEADEHDDPDDPEEAR